MEISNVISRTDYGDVPDDGGRLRRRKIGLFRTEDSKVLSNMVVYICSPCIIVNSFQIELTKDKVQGLLIAIVVAAGVHAA